MNNKIIPNLVDQTYINTILNKKVTIDVNNVESEVVMPKCNSLMIFIKKYWLLIIVVLGILIFVWYKSKSSNKKEKFSREKTKKTKKKKIEKYTDANTELTRHSNQNHNKNTCEICRSVGEKYCPKCNGLNENDIVSQNPQYVEQDNFDYAYDSDIGSDMPQNQNNIQYQSNMQYQSKMQNQQASNYYGQAITDDVMRPSNDIDSFNSGSFGNYVAF